MGWGKGKGKKNESKREEKRREIKDRRVREKNGVKVERKMKVKG